MDIVKHPRQDVAPPHSLKEQMDDLANRFFRRWGSQPGQMTHQETWWPPLDIAEREDAFIVKAEIPGMNCQDIDISVHENTLTVSGERKDSSEDKGENYYYVERHCGAFRRQVAMPTGIDANKVDASYHDGILTVTVPKTEKAKPKKIAVKT